MRKVELSASMEDYIEVIFQLGIQKAAIRAKEIATRMNVTRSSVTGALQTLAKEGLINYEPYEVVTLTEVGRQVGKDVVRRHRTLKEFFTLVLKVDEDEAESAACSMEHAVSREIVDKLLKLTGKFENNEFSFQKSGKK